MKQGHDNESLELDRARRQIKDLTAVVHDLRSKLDHIEIERKVFADQEAALRRSASEALGRERELEAELRLCKTSKETLETDIISSRYSLTHQKKLWEESQAEIGRLRELIEELQSEKERYKRDVAMEESRRAESQLECLRKDLAMTVNDWRVLESEQRSLDVVASLWTRRSMSSKSRTTSQWTSIVRWRPS